MTRSSFLKMALGAAVAPKAVAEPIKFSNLPINYESPVFINRPEYDYYVACVWGIDEQSCWIGLSPLRGKDAIKWMEINKPAKDIPSLEPGIGPQFFQKAGRPISNSLSQLTANSIP